MRLDAQELEWRVVVGASAALATVAARQLLTFAWHTAGWEPHEAEWGSWGQALAWGVALGAGVGAARVLAQRIAAAGFERVTGDAPPIDTTT